MLRVVPGLKPRRGRRGPPTISPSSRAVIRVIATVLELCGLQAAACVGGLCGCGPWGCAAHASSGQSCCAAHRPAVHSGTRL